MIKFNVSFLYLSVIGYLVLPILLFFFGFCRWYIAIITSSILMFGTYKFFLYTKGNIGSKNGRDLKIGIVPVLVLSLFLLFTGQSNLLLLGGSDIPWRNAIYYDLINYSWPVSYDLFDSILVYYETFWLIPAAISYLINANELSSNVILYLYSCFGFLLLFCLLIDVMSIKRTQQLLLALLFISWSSIDIIGLVLRYLITEDINLFFCDNWTRVGVYAVGIDNNFIFYYCIRSVFECLGNVYNQYICLAMCTLLFYKFKDKYCLHAYIGLLAVPYSPLGFLGLLGLIITNYLLNMVFDHSKQIILYIRKCFSVINLSAIFSIVPIFFFYYTCNSMAKISYDGLLYVPSFRYSIMHILILLLFIILSFGLYCLYVYEDNKKNSLYWGAFIILMLVPFFRVGTSSDLLFNASMPPFIVIMILVFKEILLGFTERSFKGKRLRLLIVVCLAAMTPVLKLSSSLITCYEEKKMHTVFNESGMSYTLNNISPKDSNFVSNHYKESIYYKYIMKK